VRGAIRIHAAHHGDGLLAVLRRQLLDIARELHSRGWVANHDGNVTVRLPGERLLATPTALSKRVLLDSDLIVLDSADRVVQGGRKPFSELKLHRAVLGARPDVHAVVHCHSPAATGLAVAGVAVEPRMLGEACVSLGAEVPLLPYGFANGPEQVAALAKAAADFDAVTLENHGVLAWGVDLEQAFLRAELVEHLATIQLRAMQGGRVRTIPPPDLERYLQARTRAGLGPEARAKRAK